MEAAAAALQHAWRGFAERARDILEYEAIFRDYPATRVLGSYISNIRLYAHTAVRRLQQTWFARRTKLEN
eukprot:1756693-Prymnesium_polylepis.1